jgi:hypothetical protein
MVGFAVAIAFAPAVPNEIAPATEHDHEEMDHAYSSSRKIAVGPRGRFAKPEARGNRNENDIHRDGRGGFGGMSGAVLPVLLAAGVSVFVFVVAWWLVGKL